MRMETIKKWLGLPAMIVAASIAMFAIATWGHRQLPHTLAQEVAEEHAAHVESAEVDAEQQDKQLEAVEDHLFILSDQAQWERCTKNPDKSREGCDEESSQRRIERVTEVDEDA